MKIPEKELLFLSRRRLLVKLWPVAGFLELAMMVILGLWLFRSHPWLIQPSYVFSELDAGTLDTSTLVFMAGVLPIVVLMCLTLVIILFIFGWFAISHERKYQDIIERLLDKE